MARSRSAHVHCGCGRVTQPGVKIHGSRKLRASLKRAGADLDDMKAVNAAIAAMVAAKAAARAPKRSGDLAASVRGNRAVSKATISAGRARVPYAGPIHWGHPARGIQAQPFVADTAADTEPQWTQLYYQGVQQILASVKGA